MASTKSILPTITLHMVSSLDGFVAKPDQSLDWMRSQDHYEAGKVLTEEDVADFLAGVDCYLMGARTYEQALKLGWPYGETPVVVLTHQTRKDDRPTVSFAEGDLRTLVQNLKYQYPNIWMVGGPETARDMLQQDLIDEINLSVMPILLGGGTPFFDQVGKEQRLHLKAVTTYQDGMVEMTYAVLKS
ncbi:MAG: dihydrofolate reductase family protein [Bacteroidota bacterium]